MYRRPRGFWVRRKLVRVLREVLAGVAILVSAALTLTLLVSLPVQLSPKPSEVAHQSAGGTLTQRFDMYVTNRLSDALEGIDRKSVV